MRAARWRDSTGGGGGWVPAVFVPYSGLVEVPVSTVGALACTLSITPPRTAMTPSSSASPFRILAQCPPGLEATLARELAVMGIPAPALTPVVGGVIWEGGWSHLLMANLHLRVASRVLVEVGSFRARALGELVRKARQSVDWERVRGAAAGDEHRIVFRVSASRSRLYHEGAIEERFREAGGLPEGPDPGVGTSTQPPPATPVLVVIRVHRDRITVRLDSSGAHLHLRGYRRHVGAAPMRETLAAALLLQGPLQPDGQWSRPAVVDPFCGSGTIPIEAALLARRIPPGMASPDLAPRDFACLHWPDLPPAVWEEEVARARAMIRPQPLEGFTIHGSDRDPRMVEAAQANASRAGVEGDIHLEAAPLSRAPRPDEPGWIVTNPPFGTRLGGRKSLRPLYAALGRSVQSGGRMAGWNLLYLSADPVLDLATGLALEERMATRHGGLAVRGVTAHPHASGF